MRTAKILLLCATSMLAPPAFAQTQDDAADRPAGDDEIVVSGKYTIDERIDTATGLGLTPQETPQSVSVITEQRILDQNLISAADVLINSVGVSVNELDDIRNQFYARGFEINNTQIDGISVPWDLAGSRGETSIDVSIYERIEVVRGATGLLTGAGNPSASINFVRKHADGQEWGGYVNASYGSWDTWRVTADVGGPVTADGRVRVRGVGRYERGDSYIDLYQSEKFVLYGVAEADVTDTTLVRAGISHQELDTTAPSWGNLPNFYSDGTLTDWPRSKAATADWAYWDTTNQNIFATLEQQIGDDWSVTLNYNRLRNTERAKLLYLSGLVDKTTGNFVSYDPDGDGDIDADDFVPSNPFPYKDRGAAVQNSYDAQIKGAVNVFGRDHEIVLGAMHSVQNRFTDSFSATSAVPNPDYNNWDGADYPEPTYTDVAFRASEERVKQTGFYGAVRLNLTDELKVIGGGRISNWSQLGSSYGVVSDYGDKGVFVPYVGALYDITPNVRLYASYTKIFQPQGELDRDLVQLPPLSGKSYEIGVKSEFFDNQLQTSFALFRIEQDNVPVIDIVLPPDPVTGRPETTTYVAAQGNKVEGFEFEVNGSPIEGWNLNFGYSHLWGDVLTDQPRRLLKLFTTYTVPIMGNEFTFGGGVNYRSRAYSPGVNPVTGADYRFEQTGYALVSLMARYELNDRLQFQANVENLLDKTYYAQVGFYEQYRYGAPRNFTVGATYKF